MASDVVVPNSYTRLCELPTHQKEGDVAPVAIVRWVPATKPELRQFECLAQFLL
jgi:hypothetical protein